MELNWFKKERWDGNLMGLLKLLFLSEAFVDHDETEVP